MSRYRGARRNLEHRPLPLAVLHQPRPHRFGRVGEHQLGPRRHDEPVAALDLRLELPGSPPGVTGVGAKPSPRLLATQHALDGGTAGEHVHVAEDGLGLAGGRGGALQHEDRRREHRSAEPHLIGAIGERLELGQDLR